MSLGFVGWNSFIHSSIQLWEAFYIQWIKNGKNTLVVYYDNLVKESLEDTLQNITQFLHFQWNKHRIRCIFKHDIDTHQTNDTCLPKGLLDIASKQFISHSVNCGSAAEKCTFNIYAKKHIIWINSAIRNVQQEIKNHGVDSSVMSNYKNKNILLSVCN